MKLAFAYKPRPPRLRVIFITLGAIFAIPALALVAALVLFVVMPPAGADTSEAAQKICTSLTPLLTKSGQKVFGDGWGNHAKVMVYGVVTTADQDEVLRVAVQTLSTLKYRGRVTVYFYDPRRAPPLLRKIDLQQKR